MAILAGNGRLVAGSEVYPPSLTRALLRKSEEKYLYILKPLGDPQEASIATALDFLAGRSCTAIGAVADTTAAAKAEAPTARELLMPEAPSPAQLEIPGLQ